MYSLSISLPARKLAGWISVFPEATVKGTNPPTFDLKD
jgi:hypothetical protein